MNNPFAINYQDSTSGGVVTDSDQNRLVEVGSFRDADEPASRYVYIVNRRVWPNKTSDDTLTDNNYLGNVAVRKIRFKVKPQLFGIDSTFAYWEITDYTTGEDVTVATNSLYSVRLQPGEGRLFRIAPAVSLHLGEMATNLYNNARHIAPIEETDTVRYATVYEKGRSVRVSYPIETPDSTTERLADSPVDVEIEGPEKNSTPAISYSRGYDRVGVIYADRYPSGPDSEQIDIIYQFAPLTDKENFSGRPPLATFIAPKGFVPAPTIATYSATGSSFWVAWRHPSAGAVIRLLNDTNVLRSTSVSLANSQGANVRFVSIAAREGILDSLYVAFEEKDAGSSSSHIYFTTVGYDGLLQTMSAKPVERISYGHGSCRNYSPQVCISDHNKVSVVWDVIGTAVKLKNDPTTKYPHYVLYRNRDSIGRWGRFTSIRTFYKPDNLLLANDTLRNYPNVAYSTNTNYTVDTNSSLRWTDKVRISWNNPITNMVGIGREVISGNKLRWKFYDLLQPSCEPAMPMLTQADSVVHPLMFRSPDMNESGYFDARITDKNFPITRVGLNTGPIVSLSAGTSGLACKDMVSSRLDTNVLLKRKSIDQVDTINFSDGPRSLPPPYDDSLFKSIEWNDRRLRTENFKLYDEDTIHYERFFRVGMLEEGDTADAEEVLVDSQDYVKIRVLLRNSITNIQLVMLDSCIMKKTGFFQSADTYVDQVREYISTQNYSDSVYISLEAARGNDTNGVQLHTIFTYGGVLVDAYPGEGVAYKKAPEVVSNPVPSSNEFLHTPLSVSVYPNPFRTNATVSLETVKGMPLRIEIYDLLGKRLGTLYNGISEVDKGWFIIGREILNPGTYFIRVQAGSEVVSRKIELLR